MDQCHNQRCDHGLCRHVSNSNLASEVLPALLLCLYKAQWCRKTCPRNGINPLYLRNFKRDSCDCMNLVCNVDKHSLKGGEVFIQKYKQDQLYDELGERGEGNKKKKGHSLS